MYRRSTRERSLCALPPAITAALEKHATDHQLTLDGAQARVWLTHSENPEASGFFGKLFGRRANPVDPDATHDSALVLLPTHLVVATAGEKRGTAVLSLALLAASVVRGSGVAAHLAAAVPGADDGMTISGFPGKEGRPGTYFFGLGSDAAGGDCLGAVQSAIRAAKSGH